MRENGRTQGTVTSRKAQNYQHPLPDGLYRELSSFCLQKSPCSEIGARKNLHSRVGEFGLGPFVWSDQKLLRAPI
jgi:hypothetical protein